MPRLDARLWHFDNLRHHVLMCHFEVFLLRLLVFGAHRGKLAHLERMGDVLVAGPGERRRCALLSKHLGSRLLLGGRCTTTVVLHSNLGRLYLLTTKIFYLAMVHAPDHRSIVSSITFVLHHVD